MSSVLGLHYLCDLRVSVVGLMLGFIHHGGTEITESLKLDPHSTNAVIGRERRK